MFCVVHCEPPFKLFSLESPWWGFPTICICCWPMRRRGPEGIMSIWLCWRGTRDGSGHAVCICGCWYPVGEGLEGYSEHSCEFLFVFLLVFSSWLSVVLVLWKWLPSSFVWSSERHVWLSGIVWKPWKESIQNKLFYFLIYLSHVWNISSNHWK